MNDAVQNIPKPGHMTMEYIDALREKLGFLKKVARDPSLWPRVHGDVAKEMVWQDVKKAEAEVEEALRQWWSQRCKESKDA